MNYLKKIIKNREIQNSSLVLVTNIFQQVINFIVIMLITGVLTNEDYGKYAVLNTLLSLVTDLSDMGMNSSITKFVAQFHTDSPEKELQMIRYVSRKKLRNSSIVIVVLMLSSKWIAQYMIHDSSYNIYVIIVSFCIGFTLISSMNKAIFHGRQDYKRYFYATLTDTISYVAIITIFYAAGKLNVLTVIIANIVRMFLSMIISSWMAGIRLSTYRVPVQKTESIKSLNAFGNWMLLWAVFANLQSRADVMLLSQLTTLTEVSLYDIANKLTKPVLMILSAYATVMNPVFAQLTSKRRIKEKIGQTIKVISFISIFLLIAALLSGHVITLFFGSKYENSIMPLKIMLVSLVFYVWTMPYNSALYALNKPYIFALAAGIGLVVNVIGDFLLLPRFGAVGAAWTYFAAQVEALLVAYIAYKKLANLDDDKDVDSDLAQS